MRLLDKITIYYLIIAFLILLYILGIPQFGLRNILLQFFPPVLAATTSGIILDYVEVRRFKKPITPLITGLIIGLVARFSETPLNLIIISISAMIIKFLIKWENRHIFNPAAAGLLIGSLLLNSYPAWWGGGHPLIFLIWIPVMLYKMRRIAPIVGFLLPVILFNGISILTSTALLFFLSVMLIEPKTSPSAFKNGLIYGLIVGVSFIIFSQTNLDPLIYSLLLGNLGGRLLGKILV